MISNSGGVESGEVCDINIGVGYSTYITSLKFKSSRKIVRSYRGHYCNRGDHLNSQIFSRQGPPVQQAFSLSIPVLSTTYLKENSSSN